MSGVKVFSAIKHMGKLLRTSQTTQYGGYADDGNLQKGIARSYETLTTGRYAGTTNIDMQAIATATDISFTAATKTIAQVAAGLVNIKANDTIVISGAGEAGNNGTFTAATGNNAASFTVNEALTDEVAGASIVIKKREAHSNNCVLDLNTRLTWSRYVSGSLGSASNGTLPWTTNAYGEGVFAYLNLANTALLAGFADWRVPNREELMSIMGAEAPNGYPNSAFASWGTTRWVWASTTLPTGTTSALLGDFLNAGMANDAKVNLNVVILVRG